MKDLLEETINTLEHAKVFISSKQKMHSDGQVLYQQNIDKLKKKYEDECLTAKIIDEVKKHEEIINKANEEIKDDTKEC